jgi:hypothetical protein
MPRNVEALKGKKSVQKSQKQGVKKGAKNPATDFPPKTAVNIPPPPPGMAPPPPPPGF